MYATDYPSTLKGLLPMLDEALRNCDRYEQKRSARIDSLRQVFAASRGLVRAEVCEQLGYEYGEVDVDSAIVSFDRGHLLAAECGDSTMAQRLRFESLSLLPAMGDIRTSLDKFNALALDDVYPENLTTYYGVGNRLFMFVSAYYPVQTIRRRYSGIGVQMTDSLLSRLDPHSMDFKLYRAQEGYIKGDSPSFISDAQDVVRQQPIESRLFAKAALMLGLYYGKNNKHEDAAYYFALSAISDIRGGVSNGLALQELGVQLYELGDMDRAYACLSQAVSYVNEANSMMYASSSTKAIPVIIKAFYEQNRAKVRHLTWLLVVLCVALLVIVGVSMKLRRDKERLESLKRRLAESNNVKDAYISQFLHLCSIYMAQLEEFHKTAGRKITAGQVEDLYSMIKSGKMLEEQSRIFYEVFDEVFIRMYPTFVDEVNNLLQPERQIILPEGGLLNTELRILAFMRLGIDDSAKVARFLGVSLNTIYTYRNKLKSRARNRETFEHDIMQIGQIM
jgi:tetratricopeptide (TPR) repeat protein